MPGSALFQIATGTLMLTAMTDQNSAIPPVSSEVLDDVAELLGCTGDRKLELAQGLEEIADEYHVGRMFDEIEGRQKALKQSTRNLIVAVDAVLGPLSELSPAVSVGIGDLAGQLEPRVGPLSSSDLSDLLIRWRHGAEQFLSKFDAPKGRPPDFPLETAVRALLALIEGQFSSPVRIVWNKHSDREPGPRSPGTRALIRLLTALPDPPTQTAILNMVEKVRSQPLPGRDLLDRVITAHVEDEWFFETPPPPSTEGGD